MDEKEREERATVALNLWGIENRIRELQLELEEMYKQKEQLLSGSKIPQNPEELQCLT